MKLKTFFRLFLALVLSVFIVGCTQPATEETVENEPVQETETVVEESEISEEESVKESDRDETRTITDMAGRELVIPIEINKVYGVNNNATYMLYTLVPEKLIGWNVELSGEAKRFIQKPYQNLPVLGALYGNATKASPEEILVHEPEVIIMSDRKASKKCVKAAEELQSTLNIPVIIIENGITSYDEAYTLLGEVFNVEKRATELSDFYLEAYEFANKNSPSENQRKKVYYARTKNGLGTDFSGSYHTEILDLIGADNVAVNSDENSKEQSGKVTIEQVMEWNPGVIVVGQMGSSQADTYNMIMSNAKWAGIDAVANGEVYAMPNKPFNWFDRPPSVNRIIGIKYLGNILYPEIYDLDINEYVKEFFKLYYRYELSDEELISLIGE